MYIIHLEYIIHLYIPRHNIPTTIFLLFTSMLLLSEGGRYLKSVTSEYPTSNHLITEGGGFKSSLQSMNTSDIRRPGVCGYTPQWSRSQSAAPRCGVTDIVALLTKLPKVLRSAPLQGYLRSSDHRAPPTYP